MGSQPGGRSVRRPHHPDCAVSRDTDHKRVPACTCKTIRRLERRQWHAIGSRPMELPDGVAAIGNGNYWRTPLHGSD